MTDALFAPNARYQVVRRLAAGGMGEVLLADFRGDENLTPGLVVIKRTLPNSPQKEHQNDMLREEGRVAIRLLHANLVETFFVDESMGEPLLVMEYLAGRSMAQVLGSAKKKRETVPIDICLAVLRASACGLHFAHTLQDRGRPLGLVHRDVSPANIFVTFDGKVKVIDFGVAKADDSEIRTSTGILKGKIGYMSPEHAVGSKLTAAADLWSLGVVLWESLLAERLFLGQNPSVTLYQITTKPIDPPSRFRPDIPRHVDELCMALLERDLDKRIATGAALVERIDRLPEARNLARVDLGAFLSGKFAEDAKQGQDEAAHVARGRRRVPVPAGLVDGAAPVGEVDEDVATVMLGKSELAALAQRAADGAPGRAELIDEDARTMRLTPVSMDGDVVTQRLSAEKMEEMMATTVLPPGDVLAAVQKPSPSSPHRASPSPTSSPRVPASSTSRASQASPRPRRAGPSAVGVALATFGVLALAMGAAFAAFADGRAKEVPPALFAVKVSQGYDVIFGDVGDAPEGIARDQVRQLEPDPLLWKAGDSGGRIVKTSDLMPRLIESGVLDRARQPKTERQRISAGLPPVIALVGLWSLLLALPSFLMRDKRMRIAGALTLALAAAAASAVVWRYGALGWPGTEKLYPQNPPRLEWR